MMFSGHTCALVIDVCTVCYYPSVAGRPAQLVVVVLAATEAALILSARKHYTADVLVAVYVGSLLFFCGAKYFPDAAVSRAVVSGKGDLEAGRKSSSRASHHYEQLATSSKCNGVPLGAPGREQADSPR